MIFLAASALPLWRSSTAVFLLSAHLGPMRFTPYGLCAALGLIAAMILAGRLAPGANLDRDAVWDAGLVAIFSCFVSSRLLLVLESPSAFVHFPLVLLGLPSLSLEGMALAGVATAWYLHRKRLPLLPVLDAFAAPSALLAAFLELGRWLDRSEPGMPTPVPWGVPAAGDPAGTRVHPVALYGLFASAILCVSLRQAGRRGEGTRVPGRRAAWALAAGGGLAFLLDMLSIPPATLTTPWLEPGQWIALLAILLGALLWAKTENDAGSGSIPPRAETGKPSLGTSQAVSPQPNQRLKEFD